MSNPIYIVICGTKEPYVAERDLKDMGREETIKQLAAGEWGDINDSGRFSMSRFRVSSIIEVGSDRDTTDEFIAAARLLMEANNAPADRAYAQDHVRDLHKHEVA